MGAAVKVHCLLTIPRGHSEKTCTIVLDSIRIGFPTADIHIHVNHPCHIQVADIPNRIRELHARCTYLPRTVTHFDWITNLLRDESDEALVLLDGDVIFWRSVEDFPMTSVLNGAACPAHFSPFYNAYCFSRLHTSLLFVSSPNDFRRAVVKAWPPKRAISRDPQTKPWFSQELIAPHYTWINQKPLVYDTMSSAFQCIGGRVFSDAELDCFEHLNSAAFFNIVQSHVLDETERRQFLEIHSAAETKPQSVKGCWRLMQDFYAKRKIPLYDYLHPNSR